MPSPREKSIWGNIRVQLNEVQNLILNGRYQNAVILNREILKTVVRLRVDRACLVADSLSADIQQLFSARAIDAATRDHYNEIRNYAEQAEAGVNPGAQGANQAFSLMKDELEKYMDSADRQAAAPVSRAASAEKEERPRVPLSGKAGRSGAGTERAREMSRLSGGGSGRTAGRSAAGRSSRTGTAAAGRSTAKRSGRSSEGMRRNARNEQPMEIDVYSVLKIAIPVACVLLVIILIRVLTMGGGTIETTAVPTTPAAVETTAAPETTEAETTEEETTEAVPSKMVTTSGVRVRTKPSTEDSEVLDVLDPDTEVTYKGAYDNEWAIIDYNGQEAYVSSQYLKAAE